MTSSPAFQPSETDNLPSGTRSAEIICVGTELLLGDILNGNAQFLAKELASLGIAHYYQTVVGDNPARIQQAVTTAAERFAKPSGMESQLLLFTGGLGPTPDDLTIETLADLFGAPLVEHPDLLADIETKFTARGRTMPPSNRKQALLPEGAMVLPNPQGTAPGIIWSPRPGLTLMTFPGVPREMQAMWKETAVPYLRAQGWVTTTIVSRMLRFWGISESALAEQVAAYLSQGNPTVAPYASKGEAKLRISARADSTAAALAKIEPVEAGIRKLVGADCYGADDDTLASVVGKLLLARQQTVAVAESCTGGGLGQLLTDMAGSSAYFHGGVIAYDNRVKVNLLKVDAAVLEEQGAVSAIVAEQMALGVKALLQTDWALSITGIAGPDGGSETKPVGLVYIGLATPGGEVLTYKHEFSGYRGRDWVRQLSALSALDALRRNLL
ncbi:MULTISPECIES: competence/damage-inducible protein A [Cyanophyceae]|uniref:CinA-like protein n=1 Tax=Leptolyngbya subtilissima DQ-A4 TaxID=2933933 RepID=A0ABV0K4W6_9CYAN|nr:competence/damage-inducible protein A [Nodosilinea sp. FACHB-141]MBD2112760.1 competence/damage-inducible protein A [Nodosilinea sp. FACHB-141]